MILVVMVGLGLSEEPPRTLGFWGWQTVASALQARVSPCLLCLSHATDHPFPALPALQRQAPWGQPPIRQHLFELDPLTNLGQT